MLLQVKPVGHLTKVVFPAPFGPSNPKSSPERILTLTWSKAVTTSECLLFRFFFLRFFLKNPKIPLRFFLENLLVRLKV